MPKHAAPRNPRLSISSLSPSLGLLVITSTSARAAGTGLEGADPAWAFVYQGSQLLILLLPAALAPWLRFGEKLRWKYAVPIAAGAALMQFLALVISHLSVPALVERLGPDELLRTLALSQFVVAAIHAALAIRFGRKLARS